MEEAEELSSKMGILTQPGVFKCFGIPQSIKDKFGAGFEIELRFYNTESTNTHDSKENSI